MPRNPRKLNLTILAFTTHSFTTTNNQSTTKSLNSLYLTEDMGGKTGNKAGYFDKLKGLLEEYKTIFIVAVDNVSSQQMHEIRQSLRGEGVVLMGKNTMVWNMNKK